MDFKLLLKFPKNKYCLRLNDELVNAVLRILTFNMISDTNELAEKLQSQKSHKKLNICILLNWRINNFFF